MEQKENIKIGLLGLIAVTLIVNTFMQMGNNDNTAQSTSSPQTAATVNNNISPATQPDFNLNPPVAETVPAGPKTSIQFEKSNHDFGKIKQDTDNKHIFKFKNTGNEPLIISNAKGSCGCTVPKYPTEPIAPGTSGEIEVVYSPGKQQGQQTKTVTITANTDPATINLQISATVDAI
jgi:hypothetical protein